MPCLVNVSMFRPGKTCWQIRKTGVSGINAHLPGSSVKLSPWWPHQGKCFNMGDVTTFSPLPLEVTRWQDISNCLFEGGMVTSLIKMVLVFRNKNLSCSNAHRALLESSSDISDPWSLTNHLSTRALQIFSKRLMGYTLRPIQWISKWLTCTCSAIRQWNWLSTDRQFAIKARD